MWIWKFTSRCKWSRDADLTEANTKVIITYRWQPHSISLLTWIKSLLEMMKNQECLLASTMMHNWFLLSILQKWICLFADEKNIQKVKRKKSNGLILERFFLWFYLVLIQNFLFSPPWCNRSIFNDLRHFNDDTNFKLYCYVICSAYVLLFINDIF